MQGASGKASCQEQGGSIMANGREILKIVGIAGLTLLIGQGCSQKSIRVTADSETFDQGAQYSDNQAGADNPFVRGFQPFGAFQGDGSGQPGWSQQGESKNNQGSAYEGFEPESPAQAYIDGVAQGDAGSQSGGSFAQRSAQDGLSYFGDNQDNPDYYDNSGPFAGLQEYGGGSGGTWGSGQGYQNGYGGNMPEEFIQEDYDNITEAQPFSSRGLGQGGRYGEGSQGQDAQSGQFSRVQVEMQDVFFEFNSWRISQGGRQALAHDAEWLDQNQSRSITVEGHCDQRGSRDYNLVLGKKRAGAVQAYLVDLGVETQKIQVISYGKERPFCFGNNDQCYQLNRRGHLQLHH